MREGLPPAPPPISAIMNSTAKGGASTYPDLCRFPALWERVTAVNERIPALWFGVVRSSGAGDSGAELVALRFACPTVCAPFACSPARPLRAASWRSRALRAINLDFLNFPPMRKAADNAKRGGTVPNTLHTSPDDPRL